MVSQVDAPTAFSPNFDGVNDVFSLKTLGIINEQLTFLTDGETCFQSSSSAELYWILQGSNCTNGRLHGSSPIAIRHKLKKS